MYPSMYSYDSLLIEIPFTAHSCSICKVLCSSNKMDWLSTSAEHMNSHAMHFPCLKANATSSSSNSNSNGLSNNNNNNIINNNNNNNNELNNNRVLACKDCINYLTSQWESMDAERVPLEHRRFHLANHFPLYFFILIEISLVFAYRYNIPSPMMTSSSPNGSRHGAMSTCTPPSTPSVTSSTPASTSIYCFLCGLHSDLTLARILYGSKEVQTISSQILSI